MKQDKKTFKRNINKKLQNNPFQDNSMYTASVSTSATSQFKILDRTKWDPSISQQHLNLTKTNISQSSHKLQQNKEQNSLSVIKDQNEYDELSFEEFNIGLGKYIDDNFITDNRPKIEPLVDQDQYSFVRQNDSQIAIGNKNKRSKQTSNRKKRITITEEKLKRMNELFKLSYGKRQIAKQLNLSYSTVTHKYHQFKALCEVKPGVLIQKRNEKRNYKKSVELQQILQKQLQENNFSSAVQISSYIFRNYGKKYNRAIISRNLNDMKKKKAEKLCKVDESEYNISNNLYEIESVYLQMIRQYVDEPNQIIFIDHIQIEANVLKMGKSHKNKLSVMIGATKKQIVDFNVKYGSPSSQQFNCVLKAIPHEIININKLCIVTGMHEIYRNQIKIPTSNGSSSFKYNRIYFPPTNRLINPVKSFLHLLKSRVMLKSQCELNLKEEIEIELVEQQKFLTNLFMEMGHQYEIEYNNRRQYEDYDNQ